MGTQVRFHAPFFLVLKINIPNGLFQNISDNISEMSNNN
jgi:hypothetical protein